MNAKTNDHDLKIGSSRNNQQQRESRFHHIRGASVAMTGSSEEEDDYMNMVIAEPTQIIQETSIQRAARKKKEVGTSYVSRIATGAGANRPLG